MIMGLWHCVWTKYLWLDWSFYFIKGGFLCRAPRPVTVEPLDQKDEEDGFPEKFINKTDGYKK